MLNKLNNWTAEFTAASIELRHSSGISLHWDACSVELKGEPAIRASLAGLQSRVGDLSVDIHLSGGHAEDWAAVTVTVRNRSLKPLAVQRIALLDGTAIKGPAKLSRHLISGEAMIDYSAMVPTGERVDSVNAAGWSDEAGTCAVVLGFADLSRALCRVREQVSGGLLTATALVEREGIVLAPGATLELPALVLGAGSSLMELMHGYGKLTGDHHAARHVPIATGWCSWYDYYGTETEADILLNAENIAGSELKKDVRVIQIDDGWNLPTPEHARVWGDWTPGAKFPHGMKHTADRIHALGFEAGLWLAPFAVDPASALFREHPDWLIKDETGAPKGFWGVYGLDLTQPAVLGFIRETFQRVFNEWGYDYIKIDFLFYAVIEGQRADATLTSVEAFRAGMAVIREVAGDRFVLNCGSPMGPSIGLCDAMRIGPDVSSRWRIPLNEPEWPIGNCCIYAAAIHTIWRQWMHRNWWQNDPDCLTLRDNGSQPEKDMFGREFGKLYATEPPYGLSVEEAGFWLRLVWMTGGMALISENMNLLSADRTALLQKAWPLNGQPTRVVDSYSDLHLAFLRTTSGPLKVGVFNLSNEAKQPRLLAAKLGLTGGAKWRERLSGETLESTGTEIVFPSLPGRSGRIWENIP
jgi:alpha-galactosidase